MLAGKEAKEFFERFYKNLQTLVAAPPIATAILSHVKKSCTLIYYLQVGKIHLFLKPLIVAEGPSEKAAAIMVH